MKRWVSLESGIFSANVVAKDYSRFESLGNSVRPDLRATMRIIAFNLPSFQPFTFNPSLQPFSRNSHLFDAKAVFCYANSCIYFSAIYEIRIADA